MNCSPDYCGWTNTAIPPAAVIEGIVWGCGDEWCDCTEAQVQHWISGTQWKKDLTVVWRGKFHTDGDGWRDGGSRTELNRMAQHLRRHHHALYKRIRWPWST